MKGREIEGKLEALSLKLFRHIQLTLSHIFPSKTKNLLDLIMQTSSSPVKLSFQFQNFYLIDKSLVVFIFVMIGRRFFYCLLVKALELVLPDNETAEKALKFFYLGLLEFICLVCNIKIYQNYSIMNNLYLVYP